MLMMDFVVVLRRDDDGFTADDAAFDFDWFGYGIVCVKWVSRLALRSGWFQSLS
jgi:hypothetical protein